MSFVTQDDVKNLIEAVLQHCWPPHLEPLCLPLPRISYAEAIQQYGSDKPDTRYGNLVVCFIHTCVHIKLNSTLIMRKCFASVWNSLPNSCKQTELVNTFKCKLKSELFYLAYGEQSAVYSV